MLKEKLEAFYEQNRKPINIILLVVLPLIGGVVGATLGYQAKGMFGAFANFIIGWICVYFSYLAYFPISIVYGILFSKDETYAGYRMFLIIAILIFIGYWVYKFFSIYSVL
jgi:hypothetical protein